MSSGTKKKSAEEEKKKRKKGAAGYWTRGRWLSIFLPIVSVVAIGAATVGVLFGTNVISCAAPQRVTVAETIDHGTLSTMFGTYPDDATMTSVITAQNPRVYWGEVRVQRIFDYGCDLTPYPYSTHYVIESSYNITWQYQMGTIIDDPWLGTNTTRIPYGVSVDQTFIRNRTVQLYSNPYSSLQNELRVGVISQGTMGNDILWQTTLSANTDYVFLGSISVSLLQESS